MFRLALPAALLLAGPFLTASPLPATEGGPGSFSCSFRAGSTITYSKGGYRAAPVRPLTFDISGIDLDGQRATLETGTGKGELRIVRAVNANHYLEVMTEGFLNITTIYDRDPRRQSHPAVHSRHLGLFGEPIVAQYHGFCKPK